MRTGLWRFLVGTAVIAAGLAAAAGPAEAESRGVQPGAAGAQAKDSPTKNSPNKNAKDAGATPRSDVNVFISAVDGAPGDGASSLSSALKKSLTERGIKVSESPGQGAYTIKATVTMGEAEHDGQPVTIKWLVFNPQGKALTNTVVQRNKVPSGSLDGKWGETAEIVGSEAAKGVLQMLPAKTPK